MLTPICLECCRTATANASGLDKLNEELQDVTRIVGARFWMLQYGQRRPHTARLQMNKNMEDLLWRGDSLDRMSTLSSSLKDESLKYRKAVGVLFASLLSSRG